MVCGPASRMKNALHCSHCLRWRATWTSFLGDHGGQGGQNQIEYAFAPCLMDLPLVHSNLAQTCKFEIYLYGVVKLFVKCCSRRYGAGREATRHDVTKRICNCLMPDFGNGPYVQSARMCVYSGVISLSFFLTNTTDWFELSSICPSLISY